MESPNVPENIALVVAAGRGSLMPGDTPKQYRDLYGRQVLRRTLEAFHAHLVDMEYHGRFKND